MVLCDLWSVIVFFFSKKNSWTEDDCSNERNATQFEDIFICFHFIDTIHIEHIE